MLGDNVGVNARTHNLTQSHSEIAAVFEGDTLPFDGDLISYPRATNINTGIKILSKLADPMVYPLLFPHGETGYIATLIETNGITRVTMRQYYAYRTTVRPHFRCCTIREKLFQQYLLTLSARLKPIN